MQLPANGILIFAGLTLVVGAIECFLGYRLFKVVIALTGFLIGGLISASLGYTMSNQELCSLLYGILGGLIGAALLYILYFAGIFLLGVILGIFVGVILYAAMGCDPQPAVLVILAVLGGVLALIFQKFMIIVSTAFGGSFLVVMGISIFARIINPADINLSFRSAGNLTYVILLCWVVLGIAGVIVQYRSSRSYMTRMGHRYSPEKEERKQSE